MSAILTAALPAFLASLVEFVEALTIVLAVGQTRGWRPALLGTAGGVATLGAIVAIFGPALRRVPLGALQLAVGVLLLFFGLRWLRKAALRYAGVIALHDEAAIFARQTVRLRGGEANAAAARTDWAAVATAYQAVLLEGLEVVFIVIAVGATAAQLVPAAVGAALAGLVVIGAGFALRAPLARVPENALKFAVGVMLSAFGTFWAGEGVGTAWPGADVALLYLTVGYALAAAIAWALARRLQVAA